VDTWHANSDEVDAIDYNLDFGRSASLFDGSIPYRYSDHDPLIATLNLKTLPGQCMSTLSPISGSPVALSTPTPTAKPTQNPTQGPTAMPTHIPTNVPTVSPTPIPTSTPTPRPTSTPSLSPSVDSSCEGTYTWKFDLLLS
jgi:hypothetical protein